MSGVTGGTMMAVVLARGRTRNYWPRKAWLVMAGTIVAIVPVLAVFVVRIAQRQFAGALLLIFLYAGCAAVVVWLMLRFRDRFDEHVATDGETYVHYCSARGELVIRREEVTSVLVEPDRVELARNDDVIVMSNRFLGFPALRRTFASWKQMAADRNAGD